MHELQTYANRNFKTTIHKSHIKAYTQKNLPELSETLKSFWNEPASRYAIVEEIPADIAKIYANAFGETYNQYSQNLRFIAENMLRTISFNVTDIECDFILFNQLRIIRKKDTPFPEVYLKRNPFDISVGEIKDDWIQISLQDLSKSFTPQILRKIKDKTKIEKHNLVKLSEGIANKAYIPQHEPQSNSERFFNHLSTAACAQLFHSDKLDVCWAISIEADKEWALRRLSQAPGTEAIATVPTYDPRFKSFTFKQVRQISGMFAAIHHSLDTSFIQDTYKKFPYLEIDALFNTAFNCKQFQYLEGLWLNVTDTHKIRFTNNIYIHQDVIKFWTSDSKNKLLYLIAIEEIINSKKITNTPSDYFKFENIIDTLGCTKTNYSFPNKRAFRNFLQLDPLFISRLFTQIIEWKKDKRDSDIEETCHIWKNIICWLGTIDRVDHLSKEQLDSIQFTSKILFSHNRPAEADTVTPYILNAIKGDETNLMTDIADYLEGTLFNIKQNGTISKTRVSTCTQINRGMTIKSLYGKSKEWHRQLNLYDQYQLLKKEHRYKEHRYKYFKPFTITRNGYEINLLNTRYSVLKEGAEMQHCLHTYHQKINSGDYVAISFKPINKNDNTKHRATLGLKVLKIGFTAFNQIKGFKNTVVTDELKSMASQLINEINSRELDIFNEEFYKNVEVEDYEF